MRELISEKCERICTAIKTKKPLKGYVGTECFIKGHVSSSDSSVIYPRTLLDGNIRIKENVVIGTGVVMVGNRIVGDNSVIECGTVVNRDIPSDSYVCGNPMRITKKIECNTGPPSVVISEEHMPKNKKLNRYLPLICNIERNANVGDQVLIEGGGEINIGKNVTIGDRCIISTSHHGNKGSWDISRHNLEGHEIFVGDGTDIGAGSVIVGGVRIGRNVRISPGSIVVKDIEDNQITQGNPARPSLDKRSGSSSSISGSFIQMIMAAGNWPVIRDYYNEFESIDMKEKIILRGEFFVVGKNKVKVDKHVLISPRVSFVTETPTTKGGIHIGAGSWLGVGSIILPGVDIGNGAIVGAGSVVYNDIKSGEIWCGNPARKIKDRVIA